MGHTSTLASLCLLTTLPVQASEPPVLYSMAEYVVTAKRFSQPRVDQAAQIIVIGQKEVEESGAGSLPELLERVAGLRVRGLYGGNPAAVDLDARGFGETGNSHVLVLLDGRRLNAPDSHAVEHWHALPLTRIQRIEVQQGSGNVLYGDNAVGAVVNIVTREGGSAAPNLEVRGGSFGTLSGGLALGLAGEGWQGQLDATLARADGYRRHNGVGTGSLGGSLRLPLASGAASLSLGRGRLEADLPGYLTLDQAAANPRASLPGNGQGWTDRDSWHLRPGLDLHLSEHLRLTMELALEHSRMEGYLSYGGGSFSLVDNRHDTWSWTPRLNLNHDLLGLAADTVIGFDLYRTDYGADKQDSFAGASRVDMIQTSQGIYAQSTLDLGGSVALTLGARRQSVDQDTRRAGASLANDHARTAWDLGFSVRHGPGLRLFARHGAVFRFAKTDELTTFSGLGTELRPEHGHNSEVGLDWQAGQGRLQTTLYRLRLRDEIAFNLATFQNENLLRTRHDGLSLAGHWRLSPGLEIRAGYDFTDATFAEGIDQGKRLPLVPRHQGRFSADWRLSPAWSLGAGVTRATGQYYGSDTDNSSPAMAGYTVWDLGATWQQGPWRLRIAGRNLGDRHYALSGFDTSPFDPGLAVYPADGRALFLTLSHGAP